MNAKQRVPWPLAILGLVFAASIGCTPHTRDSNRTTLSEASLSFQRKVECEKYAGQTEREFDANINRKEGYFDTERMFYSPKRNSCVCILVYNGIAGLNKGNLFARVYVLDALTKEELGAQSFPGMNGMTEYIAAQEKALE